MKKVIIIGIVVILSVSMMNLSNIFFTFGKGELKTFNDDNKYALLIGISDYIDEENAPWWVPSPDLPFPASEAIELKETLCSHGWEDIEGTETDYDIEGNIHVLLNHSATKSNILAQLNWLKEKEGKVLFVYRGHGTSVPDNNNDEDDLFDKEDEALVPCDATHNSDGTINVDTLITDDELLDIIEDFNSSEAVFILCTCFSGGIIEEKVGYKPLDVFNGEPDEYIRIHNDVVNAIDNYNEGFVNELEGENRVVLSSCGEISYTVEYIDSGFLNYSGTPFVTYLIEGLRGYADLKGNNDGQVSAEEAFAYLKPRADVLNTLKFLKLLASSPFSAMETILTALCLIASVYYTIVSLLHPMPVLMTLLWADMFVLMKMWFDSYGIYLPSAMMKDYDENNDIQLTESEEVQQSRGKQDEYDKEGMKEEIRNQQKVLEEYFGEKPSKSKSVNLFSFNIFNKFSVLFQRFFDFFKLNQITLNYFSGKC
jgi:hypothetical protein